MHVLEKFLVLFSIENNLKSTRSYTMPHIGVQIFHYVFVGNVRMLLINQYWYYI